MACRGNSQVPLGSRVNSQVEPQQLLSKRVSTSSCSISLSDVNSQRLVRTPLTQTWEPAAEEELKRLAITALAMFNRNSLFVTEEDLKRDLEVLLHADHAHGQAASRLLQARLSQAEKVALSFFFIYESRAELGSRFTPATRTYEFVHATFGEFLIAREVHLALAAMRPAHAIGGRGRRGRHDDAWLQAVLSWQPLAARANVVEFFAAIAEDGWDRAELLGLLDALIVQAGSLPIGHEYSDYKPRYRDAAGRLAHYTFNLFALRLAFGERFVADELVDEPREWWGALYGLWRARIAPTIMDDFAADTKVATDAEGFIAAEGAPLGLTGGARPIRAQLAHSLHVQDDVLLKMALLADLYERREPLSVLGDIGKGRLSGALLLTSFYFDPSTRRPRTP